MSYVYTKVDGLEGKAKVSNHQCVGLIQWFTKAPKAAAWREGEKVRGNLSLAKGTAIATFKEGRYPNAAHGNHAAFYLRQDSQGLHVMDQWASPKKKSISSRIIPFCSVTSCPAGTTPSDDGDAYSVVE
jgi:hypothetical protein